jgi:hypothetical protein
LPRNQGDACVFGRERGGTVGAPIDRRRRLAAALSIVKGAKSSLDRVASREKAMAKILQGMRVVEGSAFVAIPLAGMTLAQMGADVIRFDRIRGGLDHYRWPITKDNRSLFWAGLNKGKRSLAVDMSTPRGQEIVTRLICAPGPDAGLFLSNLRVRGWMDYDNLTKHREDLEKEEEIANGARRRRGRRSAAWKSPNGCSNERCAAVLPPSLPPEKSHTRFRRATSALGFSQFPLRAAGTRKFRVEVSLKPAYARLASISSCGV